MSLKLWLEWISLAIQGVKTSLAARILVTLTSALTVLFVASLTLTACAPGSSSKSDQASNPTSNSTSDEGPIDSSGGDLGRSTRAQFDAALEKAKLELGTALHRLAVSYESIKLIYSEGKEPQPTNEIQGLIYFDEGQLKYARTEALDGIFAGDHSAEITAVLEKMKVVPQDGPCLSKDGHHDSSSTPDGVVCLDAVSASRITPDVLEQHLVAMLAHEAGHILKLEEGDAKAIQKALETFEALALVESKTVVQIRNAYSEKSDTLSGDIAHVSGWSSSQDAATAQVICTRLKKNEDALKDIVKIHRLPFLEKSTSGRLPYSDLFEKTHELLRRRAGFNHDQGIKKMKRYCFDFQSGEHSFEFQVKEATEIFDEGRKSLEEIHAEFKKLVEELDRALTP